MEINEEELIEKIVETAGISREEVLKRVEEKIEEFGGLVSRAGAIIIVGKELGVELVKKKPKVLKIRNLISGLNSVNLCVKVLRIYPSREFSRENNETGRVINLLAGDETGVVRVSIWNEKVEMLKNVKEGDVIEIFNGYTREDDFGGIEVRVGKQGSIKRIDPPIEIKVPENVMATQSIQKRNYKRMNLGQVKEGDAIIVRAAISLVFERPIVHYLCPSCKTKLREGMKCEEHGEVKPDKLLILSGVIDDGVASINFVAFRKDVERMLDMNVDEIEEKIKIMGEKKFFEDYVLPLIGKEFVFRGIVRKNELTEFVELVVGRVSEVAYTSLLLSLIQEVESCLGEWGEEI